MSYKLTNRKMIIRLADGACIPEAQDNRDFQEYQKWLAAGNIPEAADPDPVPLDISDIDNLDTVLKAMALTFAQITNTPPATLKSIFKQKYQQLKGN